jgi:pullulanase
MTPSEKGTFYTEEIGNLHGTYYTYTVVNQSRSSELVDPYARSVGINGLRGLVVDFSKVNPEGFQYNDRPNNMVNATDAIIYELHVRDLTTHSSWNGSEVNRSKFLGLIEKGTTYNGVSTGFDHIIELGVTHVQILPFFDFGVLDESKVNTEGYNSFNWGYMPMNFNALEGSFSNNPYDGLVRIQEMKQVVTAFTEANIRLNMDVVYNHHGLTADSNFELLVPGYYFRKTASGAFSNGSGTGNETASERFMMRKFIVESVVFWTEEYNISGFRFDLMALHDIETMNQIVSAVRAIDPTIMIYGEPWMGGTSPLPASDQAGKANLSQMPYVGAFNDDLRDGVKGSVFARDAGGFIQGNFTNQLVTRIKYGIVGGSPYEGIQTSLLSNNRFWHSSPIKTINYVTAHDNDTLHDKLHLTLEASNRLHLIPAMSKQANAIVFTSQGIAFLHAGDEFLRSKPKADGRGFDHNSYESPDSTNQLRWDQKATELGLEINDYYKGLIALRKDQPSLRMTEPEDVASYLSFVYENITGMIAYTISNDAVDGGHDLLLIAHNANSKAIRITLPKEGGWVMIMNGEQAGTEEIATFKGGSRLSIPAHTSVVLYQDPSIPDTNPTPIIVGSSVGGTGIIGGVLFFLKKKKLWFFK